MMEISEDLVTEIRDRFAHVDNCPYSGARVFFENAGGALTLKSVVESSARFAAIPDNQGRANAASAALMGIIDKARDDLAVFMNAGSGQFFLGESGTEVLFRQIRAACLAAPKGAKVLGSTLEHPASRSAAIRWAGVAGLEYVSVPHDDATGLISARRYADAMTPEVAVATIIHTSPVTGMAVDLTEIVREIRAVSPNCLIIVDGIQHAAHGQIDIDAYDIDGYAISPYKMFSRHGYGLGWISDRLAGLPHDALIGGPAGAWELGTRDTGAYATLSDVVDYFEWLGAKVSDAADRRDRIVAAGQAIHALEAGLIEAMIRGAGNHAGLADLPGVEIIGGADNPAREGVVSFRAAGLGSADIVEALNARGIRAHIRKADHYSGNVLTPLGWSDCVRVSPSHYNTRAEVAAFLAAMGEILGPTD